MEELARIYGSLSREQQHALTMCARAMVEANAPRAAKGDPEDMLMAADIVREYGMPRSVQTVYDAMHAKELPYTTPHGCSRPMCARRADVEAWLGV